MEDITVVLLFVAARVLPAKRVPPHAPQSETAVGHDLVLTTPGSLAKGKIVFQVPRPRRRIFGQQRLEPRHDRRSKPLIALGQRQLLANRLKNLTAGEHEAALAVQDLQQTADLAELNLLGPWQKGTGQLATARPRIHTTHDRQLVLPQLLHIVGLKDDVAIDPHQLVESCFQRVTNHHGAGNVDDLHLGRAAHGIAASFQSLESLLTLRRDQARRGNQNDTRGRIQGDSFVTSSAEHHRRLWSLAEGPSSGPAAISILPSRRAADKFAPGTIQQQK